MKARIIPASKTIGTHARVIEEDKPLRVAAYCRVSTDREEQESSYEVQCQHYTRMIDKNTEWELAGIYADEGITALSTKKREQFKAMIRDCEDGKIDMIITKSISRFARNTLDCLDYIRRLKKMGIPVVFEKESINTMDAQGELLITILASIAQQESESISKNVQMGIRFHYQEGKICAGHQNMLGYERTEDGSLEVIPEEAEIVRRIFRLFLNGLSPSHIGEILREEEIIDRCGNLRRWNPSSIRYILTNEKYMGDLLLQKYYTVDFLSKKVCPNRGQVQQFYVENSHDPIIPKDIFYQVQGELARRKKGNTEVRYLHDKGLSGKVFCAECGSPYYRKKGRNKERIRYRCASKLKDKYKHIPCINSSIKEEDLMAIIINAFNQLPPEREQLIRLEERLNWGPIAQADMMLDSIYKKIDQKEIDQESRSTDELEEQAYEINCKRAEYADKEMQVKNLLTRIEYLAGQVQEKVRPQNHIFRKCNNASEFFQCTNLTYPRGKMTVYRDEEVNQFVDKIYIGEQVKVVFKAGIEITVSRVVDKRRL